MKIFKVADGIPELRVRGVSAPGATPPAIRNAPLRVRNRFGELPGPNGGPGSALYPYSENLQYGADGNGQISSPPPVGSSSIPNQAGTGFNAPNGESDRDWYNPTTFSTVQLIATLGTTGGNIGSVVANNIPLPVLQLNYQRNCLIIQNQSTATAPDTTPIFYVDFNKQPSLLGSLALPAGLGILFDYICPRDAVFISFGPFTDGGSTTVIAGMVVQGTYAPPANS